MIKRSPPLKKRIVGMTSSCKQKLQHIQNKLLGFWDLNILESIATLQWLPKDELVPADGIHPACTKSSLEEELVMEQKTLTVAQWTLDDNSGNHEKNIESKKIAIVEVEFFPNDPYGTQTDSAKSNSELNYTITGEDPNLRITHYPPSDRLH